MSLREPTTYSALFMGPHGDIIMQFEMLFEKLGAVTGIAGLALDSSNTLTLRFDEEHDITFTRDVEDRAVFFHAEVGDAAHLEAQACRTLLRASLLGAETGGGALSIHGDPGMVVLWKRHEDSFEDYTAFEQAINDFLAQIASWKQRLLAMRQEGDVDAVPADMQAFAQRI